MTYQEKKSILALFIIIGLSAVYYFVIGDMFFKDDLTDVELYRQWAKFILIFIPVQVVATILTGILSSIIMNISESVKNGGKPVAKDYEIEDEFIKQVNLKATYTSVTVFSVFVLLGLATLIFELSIIVMFTMIFIGLVLSSITMEILKLYYYKRGI